MTHTFNTPGFPTLELIENDHIILLTHEGDVDFAKAQSAMEGILYYLECADHVIHLISDMRNARLIREAGEITRTDILKKVQEHPKLGIQTMVIRNKRKDYKLEEIMKKYNLEVSRNQIVSPNGEYKRHVIYFNSIDEAKKFLLLYNDLWDVGEVNKIT